MRKQLQKIFILLFYFCAFSLVAQEKTETIKSTRKPYAPKGTDQGFDFLGNTVKELVKPNQVKAERTTLLNATIVIYQDSLKLTELKTDKKDGSFSARLEWGHTYKVTFAHPSSVPMFLIIDAHIPKKEYDLQTGVKIEGVTFIDKKSVGIDTVKYRFAFDKYMYDGKKRLVRDEKYFEEFLNGKSREYLDYQAMLRSQKNNTTTTSTNTDAPQKINFITGKIMSGDPATTAVKNVKVILVGDRGEPLQTCVTNNYGRFSFQDVVFDQNYTFKIDDADLKSLNGKKITIINKNDQEVTVIAADEMGKFTFHLLSSDKKTLALLASDDDSFIISGNLLALINNVTEPIANTKIQIMNAKGDIIEAVITNDFGTFVFTKTPKNQNFLIQLSESNPKLANVKVIITDHNGKEVNSTTCGNDGKFKFEFLKQDELKIQMMEVEEATLRLDLKGKLFKNTAQNALANTKVDLVNDKDQVVQTISTDNLGNFKFSRVPYAKNYSLNTAAQPIEKVILADANGITIKEYQTGNVVNTIKMPLLPSDQQKLTSVTVDDPWLKIADEGSSVLKIPETTVIPEKVYFEVNDFKLTKEGQVILDKVIQVMKSNQKIKIEVSSHTDSKGSDEYNMELSKKRAKSAVDYMVAHGIAKERVTGVGYGETKPVNKCANGVLCSEEEYAQNRRLEFKITHIK